MHERTGRPLRSERSIEIAESLLGRDLRKKKPGSKVNRQLSIVSPELAFTPPPPACAKWLGHQSLETTAIYMDAVGDEEREIAARMWD